MWTTSHHHDLRDLAPRATAMVAGLLDRCDAVRAALAPIATPASIDDEILRSLRVLAGAPYEILREDPPRLNRVNVFFPSNNILYSYILFGLVPSLYSRRVTIRPSSRVQEETLRVHEQLAPLAVGRIDVASGVTQRAFLRDCADTDLVVFTGTSANAAGVRSALAGGPTVLSFGSSPTPFVIGPEADVAAATRTLVAARLFNSGQDCLCPDLVFVHELARDDVIAHLRKALSPGRCATPLVGPLLCEDVATQARAFLSEHADRVVVGGDYDQDQGILEPTVVSLDWDPDVVAPELFAPVFVLMTYADGAAVRDWVAAPAQQPCGTYVSVFGEPAFDAGRIGTTIVLTEAAPLDIEDGNRPFGGYGLEAASVQGPDGVVGRPLLVSAEAARTCSARR